MLSREDIERIAAEWARRESLHRGYECTPVLWEFDVGYTVYATPVPDERANPGDGETTIIDKETGEIYSTPGIPPPIVVENFRKGIKGAPVPMRRVSTPGPAVRTAFPPLEPTPVLRRLPTPGVTARLTLSGRVHENPGAKGEHVLLYHPLVRDYLDELPPGRLVRGGDRHAELIVVSDALYASEGEVHAAGALLDLRIARNLLSAARLEVSRVREPGDPKHDTPAHPCESCVAALVHFGVPTWGDGVARPDRPAPAPAPPIEPFAAAERALAQFPDFVNARSGPGERLWVRPFVIDPAAVAHTADTLADFGDVLGVRLFPIGTEEDDSVLAVDEHGRVFALDQAGEWFLGADLDEALTNLLRGRAVPKVKNDGTW